MVSAIQYSPDGNNCCSPVRRGYSIIKASICRKRTIPNDYDSQAFLYSLGDGAVTAFTRSLTRQLMKACGARTVGRFI
ncbi:MAG: hypothetical protein R3C26_03400 [Calditrichia bacterium]